LNELLDAVGLSCADHEILRPFLLQHQPYGPNIVTRESPVALGLKIAEAEFFLEPKLDAGDSVANLAGHELVAAARRLVVEQDARASEQSVALSVVDRDEVAVDLGDAIGAARMERRRLALRRLAHLAEHFTAAGLVKARRGASLANGFK